MSFSRLLAPFLVNALIGGTLLLADSSKLATPNRDPQAVEILNRTLNSAGGSAALSAVRNVTESGEITFHWGKGVEGPVTVRMLGGNCFRLEASLPEGKNMWVV